MKVSADLEEGLRRLEQWRKIAVCTVDEGEILPEPWGHLVAGGHRVHVEFVTPRWEAAAVFGCDKKLMFCFLVRTTGFCW
jgi:hypothetical protein